MPELSPAGDCTMNFHNQLTRIRRKLPLARIFDQELAAFGAATHRYELGDTVTEAEVAAFEAQHGIELPPCYRAFVTEVGSGGPQASREGAGPAHGLYAFGTGLDEVVDSGFNHLRRPVFFHAGFTADSWFAMVQQRISAVTDNDYDQYCARLYAGILTIGHQGCSGYQGLVLNGPLRGRVLYYYQEPELMPELAPEA
ncbi:MAG: SMI1/KNR4 family protein, partial [Chitinophagaceae bacterium]